MRLSHYFWGHIQIITEEINILCWLKFVITARKTWSSASMVGRDHFDHWIMITKLVLNKVYNIFFQWVRCGYVIHMTTLSMEAFFHVYEIH